LRKPLALRVPRKKTKERLLRPVKSTGYTANARKDEFE
jgi:hypothetical protein